jgi:nucleoside triphosphatase
MRRQRYPEPTVGAVVYNSQGKILLVKSRRSNDLYVIPGGHVELGERIEDTLRREVREETGLEVTDIRLASIQQFIYGASFYRRRHFIFVDFTCRAATEEVRLNWEHDEFVWADYEEAFRLPMDPYARALLRELQKGQGSCHRRTVLYDYVKEPESAAEEPTRPGPSRRGKR